MQRAAFHGQAKDASEAFPHPASRTVPLLSKGGVVVCPLVRGRFSHCVELQLVARFARTDFLFEKALPRPLGATSHRDSLLFGQLLQRANYATWQLIPVVHRFLFPLCAPMGGRRHLLSA
jgi:hypothetical protein